MKKIIRGDIIISDNQLETLEGCNIKNNRLYGNFNCSHNNLTSLRYVPDRVDGYCICSHNNLTSLKFSPKHIGCDFDCIGNRNMTLDGCPEYVGGDFTIQGDFTEEEIRERCTVNGRVNIIKYV